MSNIHEKSNEKLDGSTMSRAARCTAAPGYNREQKQINNYTRYKPVLYSIWKRAKCAFEQTETQLVALCMVELWQFQIAGADNDELTVLAITRSILGQISKFIYIRVGDVKGFQMICVSPKNSKNKSFSKFKKVFFFKFWKKIFKN